MNNLTPFTHFIFVDFENVQDVDLELLRDKPIHVTLLIGAKQTKMPMKLATQLPTFAPQVRLIEVGGSGRNALDLTLAMHLGRELERHPQAGITIISRDKDFDPMIAHLQTTKFNVCRVTSFADAPAFARPRKIAATRSAVARIPRAPAPAPKPTPKPTVVPTPVRAMSGSPSDPSKRQSALLSRLGNPLNRNRPATEKALVAHVKNALGKDITEADVAATMQLLQTRRVLSIDAQRKVVYARP